MELRRPALSDAAQPPASSRAVALRCARYKKAPLSAEAERAGQFLCKRWGVCRNGPSETITIQIETGWQTKTDEGARAPETGPKLTTMEEENMTDAPQPSLDVARDLLIILAGAIVDLKEAVLQLGGDNPAVAASIREVDGQIAQFIEALEGWPRRD